MRLCTRVCYCLHLVVLEYLDPAEGWTEFDEVADEAGARKALQAAVEIMRSLKPVYVHGDLRLGNALVRW